MTKEVKEAFRFVCPSELWRMGLFWIMALVSSYFQLLKARIFGSKYTSISSPINLQNGSSRPICVITGVTSGLGKATAFALAEKGFYVILGFRILGLLQSPDEGVESVIDAALSTPETSGAYYFGGKGRTIESSQVSRNPKLAKQLCETSYDLFNELQLLHHNN